MTLMKAAICTRYGPPEVLLVRDVEKPQPEADEVVVRIHASTVNSSDWFIRSGIPNEPAYTRMMMKLMIGLRRPRHQILGLIVAGEVVEIGASVKRFRVGDRVYAFTKFHLGGYAQYTCLREASTVGLASTGLSFDEVAAIAFGGLLALHYLRKGGVKPGMERRHLDHCRRRTARPPASPRGFLKHLGRTPPVRGSRGEPVTGSIAEVSYLRLGEFDTALTQMASGSVR
jgi:NADPH:quinone reductase-like Zn-dependent oxidoreductase